MIFKLSQYEREHADAWVAQHIDEHHGGEEPYVGAAGGAFGYQLTPTGLGMFIGVVCGQCLHGGKPFEVYYKCITDLDTIG